MDTEALAGYAPLHWRVGRNAYRAGRMIVAPSVTSMEPENTGQRHFFEALVRHRNMGDI